MDALLERLSSGQIVAVISIITGGIVALAMIIAISKYQFQSLADDASLRQERQQADLALRERLIEKREASGERASIAELLSLGASAASPELDKIDAELAKRFGRLEAAPADIERTLSMALAGDALRKKSIIGLMDQLQGCGADDAGILAAVRPLCANQPPAKEKAPAVAASVA
jgi:hypothetical protein